MTQELKDFNSVIESIMSNWTALKLAVELSPSPPLWKQHAINFITSVGNYFVRPINELNTEDLEDLLSDTLNSNFNVICEDDSPQCVSYILMKLYELWVIGDKEEFLKEFNLHPKADLTWLQQPENVLKPIQEEVPNNNPTMMPDEDGWITVTRKK